jgi:two-component system sensor histidine kinase VicK
MFNDIITMSRLEHGQYVYHRIPLALKEAVDKILEMNASDIESKKLSVNVNIKEEDRVLVDGESFYYALSNIISNALKYSHSNGIIDISLTFEKESNAVITVSDTGVGIPKDEINGVFSRFRRGSNVKNEYPGTGLGLAIAERVVKEHNGSLFIESELDRRTTVTIVLNNYIQED